MFSKLVICFDFIFPIVNHSQLPTLLFYFNFVLCFKRNCNDRVRLSLCKLLHDIDCFIFQAVVCFDFAIVTLPALIALGLIVWLCIYQLLLLYHFLSVQRHSTIL